MVLSVLNKLNLIDYPEIHEKLKECKDNNEAWKILNRFENSLNEEIANLQKNVDPQQLLDELHRYNDIKDMTQAAMGTLANIEGVTIAKIHEQFNVVLD